MRPKSRGLVAAALLAAVALGPRGVGACGFSEEGPVYLNTANPDLPLARFAAGHLGVVGAWNADFRVVAYRVLADQALDDEERAGLTRAVREIHHATDARAIDPGAPVEAAPEVGEYVPDPTPWRDARAAALGSPGPAIANGWSTESAWTPNCLGDAFRSAAVALRERVAHYGERSDAVRAWVDAQDAVFSNCGTTPGRTPATLQDAAPIEQRRDRAYQIAAAHFYAGRYDEAERAFAAVAADADSPWSPIARYLVVRAITRAAQRGRPLPDPARLARAALQARALLADPQGAAVHDMTRRYEGWIDTLRDPAARLHALGAGLVGGHRGAAFADELRDYANLFAARGAPDPADPLTTWVAAPARDAALALYARSHQRQWLVAALQSPGDAGDPRLAPIIAAARALPRTDPAWTTAQYEQLRLRVARGERIHEEIVRASHELSDDDGPNARNLFRELALRAATDLDHFLSVSYGRAAGWSSEGSLVVAPTAAADGTVPTDLSPLAAAVLSQRVPVAVLVRAAASPTLPLPLRERLTAVALHRAAMLDDEPDFLAAAALVRRMSEAAQRPLRALAQATTRDGRRLALLRSLLDGGTVTVTTSMIDGEAAAGDLWVGRCGAAPPVAAAAWFVAPAERAALARERARQAALGDGPTWLANEAARLAARLPDEPAMAAVLAAAVRNTRNNGCDPRAPVHQASRAAFTALRRYFPRSAEARAARYWY
jgi:hypothetical protein